MACMDWLRVGGFVGRIIHRIDAPCLLVRESPVDLTDMHTIFFIHLSLSPTLMSKWICTCGRLGLQTVPDDKLLASRLMLVWMVTGRSGFRGRQKFHDAQTGLIVRPFLLYHQPQTRESCFAV